MAIARSALETIANGKTDPGVRKLARETQDGFSVLSDGEKVKVFSQVSSKISQSLKLIPPI